MAERKCLIPNFEEDIFINYNHDDNRTTLANLTGWVDTMHETLATRLTQLIGEEPKIWRDGKEMRGNDVLDETIVIRLAKTAFLVSVFSPSYVNSVWCKRELNEFYKRAAENGGIKINNKSRIFKVMKTPITDDDPHFDAFKGTDVPIELQTLLRESLGYEFYDFDNSGRLREFWPEMDPGRLTKFFERLEDLAQDIKKFIRDQRKQLSKNNIYLAETTPELNEDRNEIKRTLLLRNYHVLPDENLPLEESALEEKVRGYLQRSIMSIHLIGADHTMMTADKDRIELRNRQHHRAAQLVQKQHELAMIRGDGDSEYSRLLWMPDALTARDEDYQDFLAYIQNDPGVDEGAEVLCGTRLEDLKTIIQRKLNYHTVQEPDNDRPVRVYLLCDKQDLSAVESVCTYLKSRNCDVTLPFNEASEGSTGHKEHLQLCDAVLVFYGAANTMKWKLDYLQRINVFRDGRPMLARGIYVSGPETEFKKDFQTDTALVMKNFGEFSAASLQPFMDQIDRANSKTKPKVA
ncbi:MAG TPA: hypothetical protein VEW46_16955 [Pyrinomonadaceae bacterium]|nr:hypothetical protein [Pyrinomonadaceae bacterium]